MSCNDWRYVELGQIAEITKLAGFEFSKYIEYIEDGEIIAIRAMNVKDGVLDLENIKRIDKKVSDNLTRSKLFRDDIVITYTGSKYGEVAFINEDDKYHLAPNVAKITINKDNNPYFFFCYFKSSVFRKQLKNYGGGSSQPTIPMKTIRKILVPVPTLKEQNIISNILIAIDKKIELNNEMNKTLEEMAQALFKRWFVDFEFPNEEGKPYKSSGGEMVESELGMIPKGWNVKNLKDISTVTMGVSPSSNSYNDDKVGLPLLNGAADFEGKLIKPSKYTSEPKKVCKCGDMIFGVRATIGNTVFADKEYALGRGVASVSPKNDMFREFIYFCLNSSMNKLINSASGSVFLNLKKADITDLKLCYSDVVINKFNKIAKELINKVIENDIESEILKQQRNSLLPKLMSGEIRVDNVETDI